MLKGALLKTRSVLFGTVAIRESSDTKYVSSLPDTRNLILVESGITSGRAFKLCGAIGVSPIIS